MANNLWRMALIQMNPLVGAIEDNTEKVLYWSGLAQQQGASLVVFPELVLTGYPPEDLLLRPSLALRMEQALQRLVSELTVPALVGYPAEREGVLYNVAGYIRPGCAPQEYRKRCLPNYQVFDEKRYFQPGCQPVVVEHGSVRLGLLVCEDIWDQPAVQATLDAGADLLCCINASPFHAGKQTERLRVLQRHQQNRPVVYVNAVGGQDELVFDGASLVLQATGQIAQQAECFREQILLQEFQGAEPVSSDKVAAEQAPEAEIYQALVLAVADYVNKNRFAEVVLGLSGGIDSALTLCIAVDALGPDRVQAVMMPFRYTARMSEEDAAEQARRLGVRYQSVPIEQPVQVLLNALQPMISGPMGTTLENLQARVRGNILMALSNARGALVLTTGNKSEMAVGYATLYGDMAGGFDVLKDVYKTLVFRLARWRNQQAADAAPIPQRVIDRPPSAELAPEQKDEDTLPPYEVLDAILQAYIEGDQSAEQIVGAGYDREVVYRVLGMVDRNEYKRRQAAIGPRLTQRGFGRDRRYPVTQGWQPGR